MAVRRYIRDRQGRFASGRGSTVSGAKPERPASTGGSMTRMLRKGQRALYRGEQDRIHAIGGNVAGMRIIQRDIKRGAAARTTTPSPAGRRSSGRISDAMRDTLRQLAQSDARYYRDLGAILGSGNKPQGRVTGSKPRKPRRLKGS